ncbi:hypothetical protein C8J56DRAFT_1066717 [Mycena floridula]|nr:hypothetical protein C8J56DRAFT_1066717 [Mycena floridula]
MADDGLVTDLGDEALRSRIDKEIALFEHLREAHQIDPMDAEIHTSLKSHLFVELKANKDIDIGEALEAIIMKHCKEVDKNFRQIVELQRSRAQTSLTRRIRKEFILRGGTQDEWNTRAPPLPEMSEVDLGRIILEQRAQDKEIFLLGGGTLGDWMALERELIIYDG